jgi:hypothetical protein
LLTPGHESYPDNSSPVKMSVNLLLQNNHLNLFGFPLALI